MLWYSNNSFYAFVMDTILKQTGNIRNIASCHTVSGVRWEPFKGDGAIHICSTNKDVNKRNI